MDAVAPSRLKDGRHLLYLDATTGGNSGSPLYQYDPKLNTAFALAVHVGHSDWVANMAVPIEYHIDTSMKRLPSATTNSLKELNERGEVN